ncbi:VOC family protein [Burkholderia guangdongensis]|uniref:VOC family protein n=1 Tax=Burkholderia guangdongensis TaxID=1792500 RepID=UPI0015C8BA49|nr:VOC family protein [Burkholderia guangdongensis]
MENRADSHEKTDLPPIERPVPVVRAVAVAHVVFERKDVENMGRFLEDFGFKPCDGEKGATRYFRGYGTFPYCVEIIPSDRDAFVGFALLANSAEDLRTLADAERTKIEPCDGPGGGLRVRLTDPDGRRVDFVHGFTAVEPIDTHATLVAINTPMEKRRVDAPIRMPVQPAPVFRIGHVVLQTPSFDVTAGWYMRRFGFIPSDVQSLPDGSPVLGFFRFNRGDDPTDHHSLAILEGPAPAMLHISTETFDIEAVGQGHQYLRARGWTPHWGIGRHKLGSQVFDYWKDAVGDEWEHYADGDVMTDQYPTGYHPLERGSLWSWGDDLPDSMRPSERIPEDAPPKVKAFLEALLKPPRPWLR